MAINPPTRYGAGMAYDPASSMVVLYGGHLSNASALLDETWTWDGTTWTQRHPAVTPGGCEGPLGYDAAASQIILLCVREQQMGRGNYSVSTWAWSGATWTQLHPSTIPPGGGRMTMTYDAVGRELLLFGTLASSHTWTYANGQWKQAS
jgi:hypothetical protein